MEISSTSFYKHHNPMYFCRATVENGHVTELYQELGREGGTFWRRGSDWNSLLQECLTSLGRHFGSKFYVAVVEAAPKDNLQTREEFLRSERERKLAESREKRDRARKAYLKAKKAYERDKKCLK